MRPRRPLGSRHLLAAPDKFRGTASAREIAEACSAAAAAASWSASTSPVSDGGEGFLDCFGGANRRTVVSGPLGSPVAAGWRLDGERAVLEMAAASGLALLDGTDAVRASTRGTGELIAAAVDAGARQIVLGVGGSASTDGGAGALEILGGTRFGGPRDPELIVARDVDTRFTDAARVFGPQKGATPAQVTELTARLERLVARYRDEFGCDVSVLPGGGAAGGLAGGLAALGAELRPGFDVVAERTDLAEQVAAAELVVTGEGRFDDTSAMGKAVLGVIRLADAADVEAVIVAGEVAVGVTAPVPLVSLSDEFGAAGRTDPRGCVRTVVARLLAERS